MVAVGPRRLQLAEMNRRFSASWLFIVLALVVAPVWAKPFLQDKLPLSVTITTPTAILLGAASEVVPLSGKQTITAVFSRPVIKLGSDFPEGFGGKVPFFLDCNVPGKFRWVTTNIARFDPDINWPTDLACTFRWNQDLTTYDDAPLELPAQLTRSLTSTPLTVTISSVTSVTASLYTDNTWDANTGLADDKLPEVPPDGAIALTYSYRVDQRLVSAGLRIERQAADGTWQASSATVQASACISAPVVFPFRIGIFFPGRPTSRPDDSCVQIQGLGTSLATDTWYRACLPKGTTYNNVSGPLSDALCVQFAGLRRFRFPFNTVLPDGTLRPSAAQSRRLDLWLVHGLASGVSVQQLQGALALCRIEGKTTCSPVGFTASLKNKGTLRLSVPKLDPDQTYRITTTGSAAIRDGFGLALEGSSTRFGSGPVASQLVLPGISGTTATVESATGALTWPVLAYPGKDDLNTTSYWAPSNDPSWIVKVLRVLTGASYTNGVLPSNPSLLGPATQTLNRPTTGGYTVLNLGLELSRGPYVVQTCCQKVQWPQNGYIPNAVQLVQQTSLQVTAVSAVGGLYVLVTRGSEPRTDVKVDLYRPNGSGAVNSIASGITDASGVAFFRPGGNFYLQLIAVVWEDATTPVLFPDISSSAVVPRTPSYQGTMFLDRKVVREGESLRVSGYLRILSNGKYQLPKAKATVKLSVYPSFDPSGSNPFSAAVPVNVNYGSFHTVIPIPQSPRYGQYYIQVVSGDEVTDPNLKSSFANEGFTVADPRPPTVELTLSAPKWTRVGSTIDFSADAISYLGNAIVGAPIDVTWSLPDATTAVITITTDSNGHAIGNLNLATIPNATEKVKEGDVVTLNAVWIGPTRERLTASASVTISSGRYSVTLTTSLSPFIPTVDFGASAVVSDLETNSEVSGVKVTLTLSRAAGEAGFCLPLPPACDVTSGSVDYHVCRLQLPCIGKFVLTGCTADGSCGTLDLGQNSTQWAANLWSSWPSELPLFLNKPTYSVGDLVYLSFEQYSPASVGLLVSASSSFRRYSLTRVGSPGLQNITWRVPAECAQGCALALVLNNPRDTRQYLRNPYPLDTSRLFDPFAPYTVQYQAKIVVDQPKPLAVKVLAPRQMQPGGTANVTVTVRKDGQLVSNVQVTVLAVDKALLDLLPYPLPRPNTAFSTAEYVDRFPVSSLHSTGVLRSAVDDVFSTLLRRLDLDPWLPMATGVQPSGGLEPLDMLDDAYLAQFSSALTLLPSKYIRFPSIDDGLPNDGALPAPIPTPSPTKTGGQTDSTSPRLTSRFQATPLFYVARTNADGKLITTFKAPANLGKFVVRAFAATGVATRFGSDEALITVVRRVSLTPSTPRFVRVGDAFEAGVVVSVAGVIPSSVRVLVQAAVLGGGVVTIQGSSNISTSLVSADTQNEVRFSFRATALGTAKVSFTASDGHGNQDAVVVSFDVAAQQEGLTVATSFAVRAENASSTWTEGIDLPEALPGSGALNLTTAVGLFASEVALFSQMQQNYIRPYCVQCIWPSCPTTCKPDYPTGYWAVSTALFPALLAQYGQPAPRGAPKVVASAISALGLLTDDTYGLLYAPPSAFWWGQPTSCDTSLNTWAIWLVGSYGANVSKDVLQYVPKWREAVVSQLVRDAQNARAAQPPSRYSDFYTLAWAHLALGAGFAVPSSPEIIDDLSFSRVMAEFGKLTLETQTVLALAVHATMTPTSKPPYLPLMDQAALATVSRIRVQGRTAYIAAADGAASPADPESQALSLTLLVKTSQGASLVQKLSAYVAGARVGFGTISYPLGERATGSTLRALATYDASSGNLKPKLQLTATVGNRTILTARFNSPADPAVSGSVPWERLPSPPGELAVSASGLGEASVAAVLTFTPARLLRFPLYRGIWVERAVQLASHLDGSPTGPPLSTIPLSAMVTVTVQLTTPDDLQDVTARVLMPAGLEPVDPNLAQDAAARPECSIDSSDGGGSSSGDMFAPLFDYRIWWPVCPAEQTKPQLINLYWQHLAAGTHSYQFLAVAASVGTFVDPPTSAYVNQQPELMGLTAGGSITICDGCTAVPATDLGNPKACPGDCSGSGACDITTGTCVCAPGFSGPDCAIASA